MRRARKLPSKAPKKPNLPSRSKTPKQRMPPRVDATGASPRALGLQMLLSKLNGGG